MSDCCLVTGGAGFIGSAVSRIADPGLGRMVVVDVLHPQVHPTGTRPAELDPRAELIVADVSEPSTWQ